MEVGLVKYIGIALCKGALQEQCFTMSRIFFILTLLGVKCQPIVTSGVRGSCFPVEAITNEEYFEQGDISADGTCRSLMIMSVELECYFSLNKTGSNVSSCRLRTSTVKVDLCIRYHSYLQKNMLGISYRFIQVQQLYRKPIGHILPQPHFLTSVQSKSKLYAHRDF